MTHRLSLDVQLDAAILDFAPKYMKSQLEHLARECDERLERELLPQFHAILAQVDQERDAFEKQKQAAVRDLRAHLKLLRFDAATVEQAINQLHAIAPRHLALFPSTTSLTLPMTASPFTSASTSNSRSTPSPAASSNSAFDHLSDAIPGSHAASLTESTPAADALDLTTQYNTTMPPSLDSATQSLATAESSKTTCSPKRDQSAESDASCKRQRTAKEKISLKLVDPDSPRTVAFPNLKTGECIFRHADREGYFVIRCEHCEPQGIFTEPPLKNNRALKHFQEHVKCASGEEELTNESIFERYAWQVWGGEMASKYWIREHVGSKPHTFTPTRALQGNSLGDRTSSMRKHDAGDDFSTSFFRLRESTRSLLPNHEGEHENPRRTLRNVPRLDYAEMVAPGNNDFEAPKTVKITRATASRKRRLTKPGVNSVDSKKPFGYMSEPWPRRSAPR
ncbi:hypothetical protein F5B22DRAFT_550263 [Xylaria bambusicola]|uniref:uncharacterized protein n=1 Tax=Xylaria bambusicola TaxID=326684 RepID=UPI00200761AE|nr:uncharacterized protein F5B22DRAFT_550263 [Xylaria bambusicola]KAI0503430.1 hypothetical protein F5B22DRAFT_550263 [Xylaria bambusicola]